MTTKAASLEDLEVHEVSFVDRGANKKKFLITKRDKEAPMSEKSYPPEASFLELLGLATETVPVDNTAENGTDKEAVQKALSEENLKAAADLLQKFSDFAAKLPADKAEISEEMWNELVMLCQAMSEMVSSMGMAPSEEKPPEETAPPAEAEKNEVADVVKGALAQLQKAFESLKALDKASTSYPAEISKVFQDVVVSLKKVADSRPKKAEAPATSTPSQQSNPAPEDKTFEVYKSLGGVGEDSEVVIKMGGHVKTIKLKQLKRAVEMLQKVVSEIEASADGKDKTTKSLDDQLVKGFSTLEERINKKLQTDLDATFDKISKRLDAFEKTNPGGKAPSPEEIKKNEDAGSSFWSSVFR